MNMKTTILLVLLLVTYIISAPVSLQIGIPFDGSVDAGQKDLYIVNIVGITGNMDFILTSLSGEPSMYLSLFGQPDYNKYEYFTTGSGVLSVSLKNNSNVYLTVASNVTSNYTISVSNSASVLFLADNIEQFDVVQAVY